MNEEYLYILYALSFIILYTIYYYANKPPKPKQKIYTGLCSEYLEID
jgi:hypothetical protein